MTYIPGKKEVFRVDYKKKNKPGDLITIDHVLSKDNVFGTPYLPITLQAIVIKHGKKKKIRVLTYKAKKREKKTKGHRTFFTEIKIEKICGGS